MDKRDIKAKVLDLLVEFDRCSVASVTCDTLAKSLHASRSETLEALHELIVQGRVEYARKNPVSAQPRFQLVSGGRGK